VRKRCSIEPPSLCRLEELLSARQSGLARRVCEQLLEIGEENVARLTEIQRCQVEAEQVHLHDEVVDELDEKTPVAIQNKLSELPQVAHELAGIGVALNGPACVDQLATDLRRGAKSRNQGQHGLVRALERQPPGQRRRSVEVALEGTAPEQPGDLFGDLGRDQRVAVAVAARPEADLQIGSRRQVVHERLATDSRDQNAARDLGQDTVEDLGNDVTHPRRFLEGRRPGPVAESSLAELDQQPLDLVRVSLAERSA
jgi:hypothetical protein